jgi:Fe-S cluster assembly protein SufD
MTTLTSEAVREREVVVSGKDARPAKVRSTNPDDFAVPTGREEEWRFTPLRRLHGLHDAAVAAGEWNITNSVPTGASVNVLTGATDLASRFIPGDRIAARAFAGRERTIVVDVSAEAELDAPIRVSLDTAGVAFGHIVVTAGAHSRATVIVDYTGTAQAAINVEVIAGDGASLTYVEVHDQAHTAVHLGELRVFVGRDTQFRGGSVMLGGDVIRLLPTVEYDAPGGTAELVGVMLAGPHQHQEARTYIDHGQPHCTSDVAYKAVLHGDGAHTVWVGDVYVRHTATDIDTYELNRNLLLDDGPRADSVPNLELETGNITRAGHASVTGKLDRDQLFYLQSRGINEREARRLVVRGFFSDLVERLGDSELAERVATAVEAALAETPNS